MGIFYIHVVTVMVMVMVMSIRLGECSNYKVSAGERLTFGEMTTFMETDSHVYHMAADDHIPGNILFVDLHSLKTTDGNTMMTITGSPTSSGYRNGIGVQAEFRVITGFFQVTPNEVIIMDYMNHCIRWLDRRNASVSDFAGKCEEGGYADGMGTTARFQNPSSVIQDTRNTNHVIISDRYNNALRVLDVKTASVSTLLKSDSLDYPRAFTYDPTDEDALIITQNYGIQRLFLPLMSRENISGGSVPDFKDGSLKDARYSFCREILPLHNQIYILIDYGNHRLRVLDLLNGKVSSICTGTTDHLDGPVSECQLKNPSSLLLIGNILYIGTLTRIRSLPVILEHFTPTSTTTTPATTTTSTTTTTTTTAKITTVPTTSQITTVPTTSRITTIPTTSRITSVPAKTQLTSVPAKTQITTILTKTEITSVPTKFQITSIPTTAKITTVSTTSQITPVHPKTQISTISAKIETTTIPTTTKDSTTTKSGTSKTEIIPVIPDTSTVRTGSNQRTAHLQTTDDSQGQVNTPLPVADVEYKNSSLVIGLSVPLAGVFVFLAAALIALAIRKNKAISTQPDQYVYAPDLSQQNHNNSRIVEQSQSRQETGYYRDDPANRMYGLKEVPPPYEPQHETAIPPPPSYYPLPPLSYPPQNTNIYQPIHVYEDPDAVHEYECPSIYAPMDIGPCFKTSANHSPQQ